MNIKINHFALGARNIYESAARRRKETRLGFWTGEWVQTTRLAIWFRWAMTSSLK